MKHEPKPKPAPARTINPTTLFTWRERMGYSTKDAADALGCDLSLFRDWEEGNRPIPIFIGLAMAALAMDLSPFGAKPAA